MLASFLIVTTMTDAYHFGRRVALLSGLILAAVDAVIIMKLPQDTVADVMNELTAAVTAKMGGGYEGDVARMVDRLPVYVFIGQWIYCFLYGSFLSAIMSRYVFMQYPFNGRYGNGPADQQ